MNADNTKTYLNYLDLGFIGVHRRLSAAKFCLLLSAMAAFAAELPPLGAISDNIQCVAEPAQSYALYLPSGYSSDRLWPVILAFDPGARGRIPVERYQAAAEMYGYVVAGSNQSRNGSWATSESAIRAMSRDVGARFAIDERRVYTAGMSGGARVALAIALNSQRIAGVVASSAGFPDSKPRKSVPFVVFGTAGSEDFNYMENAANGPGADLAASFANLQWGPRLAVFGIGDRGGGVARAAGDEVGPGGEGRGEDRPDFRKRIAAGQDYLALQEIVADFEGLKDVSEYASRAGALGRDKKVKEALKQERREEEQEERLITEIMATEGRLANPDERLGAMQELRGRWKQMRTAANGESDTAERRVARRISRALLASAGERTRDAEYRKLLEEQRAVFPRGR